MTKQIAILRSKVGDAEGLIVDVHEGGAKLQTEVRLAEGEHVTLAFDHHEVIAKVVWQRDDQLGLSFTSAIPSETIRALNEIGDGWVIC